MDKASKKHWNKMWLENKIESAIDPQNNGVMNFVNRSFHAYF